MNVKYTEFPAPGSFPVDTPHFHTAEQFKAYVVLYWSYRKYQNFDIQVTGGFAPLSALQPPVVVGQGVSL